MKISRTSFTEKEYLRIRNFLVDSYKNNHLQYNWLIDRWNFCRYVSQLMHNTFHTWIDTVGLWTDEDNKIIAVVNSEGENRGEAFFQLGKFDFSDDLLNEFIDHAELNFPVKNKSGKFINLRVNEDSYHLKEILKQRGYHLQDWKEPTSSLFIDQDYDVNIPSGFRIVDSTTVTNYQKGFAHGRAFGYYKNDKPDNNDGEKAFASMRKAPDYKQELDLSIVDANDEVASFATVWHDESNQIGILEPVGTIPKYRKMGLGKAVIYEGINRIRKRGAKKMYVGTDKKFYISIGFTIEYSKEIWQQTW
ncbi:MAG: GNAT family N-acetyltransferase [Actinomycetia bacterium]|nr:GNAT family N-acetyltransferase [Actinomycetes bacterium]